MANFTEGFETKSVESEGLSEGELKFGYWFVTHKAQIRRWVIIVLIVFSVITYGYAIFATVRYYAFRYDIHQAGVNLAPATYINVAGSHSAEAIQDLVVLSRQVFSLGDGRVDIVAKVRNNNPQWSLNSFSYQFALGSEVYDKEFGFVLPGEEKYLMMLNVEGPSSSTPQVLIDDRKWVRVIQYDEWSPDHLNLVVTDKEYISPRAGEISGQLPVSEVKADISNLTAFNYNEVELQIALLSGSRLVAISKIPVQNFLSGQRRSIATRFAQSLPPVSAVEIIPTVNILDLEEYQDFEGEFDPAFIEVDDRGRRL